jgi:hypothetical protein
MAPLDIGPLVEALESLVLVSAMVRYPHRFDVVAGSPAEAEFDKQRRFAGPWSDEPLAEVTGAGNMLVFAAEDNLRSIATLITSGSLYGPFTLARSAFETAAHAWWIFDPVIALEERLCRGGNFILYSHYERRKLEREIGIPETRTAKIDDILTTAAQVGLRVTPAKKGSPRWLGSGWKDTTSLCRMLWQDPANPASTVGAVIYRLLSATPHGTMHGILRNARPVEGLPPGSTGTMAAQEVNPGELATVVASVLVAYVQSADRQMAYSGGGVQPGTRGRQRSRRRSSRWCRTGYRPKGSSRPGSPSLAAAG